MEELFIFVWGVLKIAITIVALPLSFLFATPFILLIPGKEYCDDCGKISCECNKPKTRNKLIKNRYRKVLSFWKELGFWFF